MDNGRELDRMVETDFLCSVDAAIDLAHQELLNILEWSERSALEIKTSGNSARQDTTRIILLLASERSSTPPRCQWRYKTNLVRRSG